MGKDFGGFEDYLNKILDVCITIENFLAQKREWIMKMGRQVPFVSKDNAFIQRNIMLPASLVHIIALIFSISLIDHLP